MANMLKYLFSFIVLFLMCHVVYTTAKVGANINNSLTASESEEISLIISSRRALDIQMVSVNQDEVLQLYIYRGGDFLTGADKVSGTVFDNNKKKIMDIEFVDNGDITKGDAKAMDGIYSTVVNFPRSGSYSIEAALEAKDLPLRVTRLALIPPAGGFKSWVPLEEPFNVTFSRTASLSVEADEEVEPLPFPIATPDYDLDAEQETIR